MRSARQAVARCRGARIGLLALPLVLNTGCQMMKPPDPAIMPDPAAASFPWVRLEAEHAVSNGDPIGPDRTYLTVAAEASGRRAVRLSAPGQFIRFQVTAAASGLVMRYCIPDAVEGGGLEATLEISINGRESFPFPVDSHTAWVYGDFPWSNDPSRGRAHRFFDERRMRIPPVKPGDVLELRLGSSFPLPWCVVDFVELEEVPPPRPRPEGSISLTEVGAAREKEDLSDVLRAALAEAARTGRVLWIPAGTYRADHGPFELGKVMLRGAGMWHSTLTGSALFLRGTGEPVEVSDLTLLGEVGVRNDHSSDNAFNGNFGEGSRLERVWIERFKCGVWTLNGTRDLLISHCRIRNTMADGVNFCDGTSFSMVRDTHLRNTGDDALATWSPSGDWSSQQPCVGNRFIGNRIELPWLANGIGIYGGRDHAAEGNRIVDTVFSGAAVLISSGHGALPMEGTISVRDTVAIRTGGDAYIGDTVGGLWIFAQESDIEARIEVEKLVLEEPAASGVTVHGPFRIHDLNLRDVRVKSAGEYGLHIKPGASGRTGLRGFASDGGVGPEIQNQSEQMQILMLPEDEP